MKNFLLIEHGGYLRSFTLQRLKDKNCKIFLVTTKKEKWLLKYVKDENILVVDIYDTRNVVTSILSWLFTRNIKIDAVGTFKESAVAIAADVAELLGCVGSPLGATRRSSYNKLATRFFLKERGFKNQPNFFVYDANNHYKKQDKFDYDVVVKPIFGSSSHGVIKVSAGEDISRAIKKSLLTVNKENREVFKNFKNVFLIEEYISGGVYSVDGIVQNKKIHFAGITEFVMGNEPFFTQVASFLPTILSNRIQRKMFTVARSVIKKLNFNNCGFHIEFRLKEGFVYLIEAAARLPGGGIQLGYEKAFGVDLTGEMINLWLGKKVNIRPVARKHVLHKSYFLNNKVPVNLVSIDNLDSIKKDKNVWDFYLFVKKNDTIQTYPHMPTQLFYYALESNNRPDLIKKMRLLESGIIIKYKNKNEKRRT